jgi:hypothetical protein
MGGLGHPFTGKFQGDVLTLTGKGKWARCASRST